MNAYEERELITGFVSLSPDGYFVSNLHFDYEPKTRIEWIYLDKRDMKPTHSRGSSSGIAYRYYIPEDDYRSYWGFINNMTNCDDYPANMRMFTKMLYQVQLWEENNNKCLHSWIA